MLTKSKRGTPEVMTHIQDTFHRSQSVGINLMRGSTVRLIHTHTHPSHLTHSSQALWYACTHLQNFANTLGGQAAHLTHLHTHTHTLFTSTPV